MKELVTTFVVAMVSAVLPLLAHGLVPGVGNLHWDGL